MVNQSPEQKARDKIDLMLAKAGWVVQDKNKINFAAAQGSAVREYQTDVGPASYGQIWCTSIRRFSCLIAPLLVRRLGI